MSYEDIAKRVIRRLLTKSGTWVFSIQT
jgi:hypothetical protein